MPASDVYAWAKASTKPSYSWSEITGKPSIPSISFDQNSKSSTIGSTNQPVFFNLTIDPDAYYICTVRYRLIRSGAATIHGHISDEYRDFITSQYVSSNNIYPAITDAMITHGATKLILSARADWSGGGTCQLECQYTLIKIL